MSTDADGRSSRGRAVRRTHHIADIAHHFLNGLAVATGAGTPTVRIVAAAGPWPWSAYTALELARLAARDADRPAHVAEDDALPWTVRARLGDGERDVLLVDPADCRAHGDGPVCWHLGPVAGSRLAALIAARRAPGCRLPGDGRPVGLVWCVGHEQAADRSALVDLGPLAAVVAPARIDVVCVPQRLFRRGRGGAGPDAASLASLRDRARAVCAPEVAVHVLTSRMTAAARGAVVADLHRRADAFCSGPDPDVPIA